MKRILVLLAAVMICAMCVISAAARPVTAAAQARSAITAVADAGQQDGVVQEDDMQIDLNLTSTLIIVISTVLTVAVAVIVIVLARKNRS